MIDANRTLSVNRYNQKLRTDLSRNIMIIRNFVLNNVPHFFTLKKKKIIILLDNYYQGFVKYLIFILIYQREFVK
jgi:hypothetical protein